MHQRWRHTIRSDEGQVLVLFALMAFVLVGCIALAVDVGYLLTERRSSQNIADAAALAGASAILAGESHTTAESVAVQYANLNGASASTTIDPDAEGDRWSGSMTVDITQPVQKLFLGALYTGSWQVGTHAVADIVSLEDARYALVALDPPGLYVNGSMQINVTNGGLISNDIIDSSGDSNIVTSDGFIDAAGSIDDASGWSAEHGIRPHRAPIDDPFADYAPPPQPSTPSPPFSGNLYCNPPAQTHCAFTPGHYQNANIRIWTDTVFAPGLYYFENSNIELVSTNARIEGLGVNFYFTGNPNQAYFDPQNGEVHLTAEGWPTPLGDWRDIAIWLDMCPGPEFDSQGDQEFFVGGVIYAPCSEVYLHGNPVGETVSGMVVASYIQIHGSSAVNVSYIPYSPTVSYEVYLRE